jgi:hypothetical protein
MTEVREQLEYAYRPNFWSRLLFRLTFGWFGEGPAFTEYSGIEMFSHVPEDADWAWTGSNDIEMFSARKRKGKKGTAN